MIPRLKETYRQDVVPALMKEFGYRNAMEVPRLEKIVINIGMGEAIENPKAMDSAASDIAAITGQKPVITRARRSIANFKIREGNADRTDGDGARRPHVGVPRPAGERRSAAHP